MKSISKVKSKLVERFKSRGNLISTAVYVTAALMWNAIVMLALIVTVAATGPTKLDGVGPITTDSWRYLLTYLSSSLLVALMFRSWIRRSRGLEAVIAAGVITLTNAFIYGVAMLPFDKGYVGGALLVVPAAIATIAIFAVFAPVFSVGVALMGLASMHVMRVADSFAMRWRVSA